MNLDFDFDGGPEMWSTLIMLGSLLFMFGYGALRREHTRVWPILVIGIVLDIATQVWFASRPAGPPGLYKGFVLFPLYCTAATVIGIMTRVVVDAMLHGVRRRKLATVGR